MQRAVALILLSLFFSGCTTNGSGKTQSYPASSAASSDGLALTKSQAVEVCEPSGEREYLSRLKCPDGRRPTFTRKGSVGERTTPPPEMTKEEYERLAFAAFAKKPLKPGEPDLHIVDAYSVSCGSFEKIIYLDMYHCPEQQEKRAPSGFNID